MSVLQQGKMLYRNFGNSGLKVSVISLGNMINYKPENYEEDKNIILTALKNGINHIDTAEIYASGEAETTLGRILKELNVPRDEIVIATKIHTARDPSINSSLTTNRKHIRESINYSLQRLQLDYVDILYAHFYDANTPLEEICRAFHEVIEEGKSFYWATSNWDAESVFNALAICEKYNLHKPIGAQNEYNMLVRKYAEVEYQSLFEKYNYGLIAWSPLAGGFLTGKHLEGINPNEKTRLTEQLSAPIEVIKTLFYTPFANEATITNLTRVKKFAEEELGCTLLQLAIAWTIHYQHTDSALIGARSVAQLEGCLKVIDILSKFTPEVLAKVNKILDNNPTPRFDYKAWRNEAPVRPVAP